MSMQLWSQFTTVRIDSVKKEQHNFTVVSNKFFFTTHKAISMGNDADGSRMRRNI